jgi:hypothetical protein
MTERRRLAMIGDIVDSRNLPDRGEVQLHLRQTLPELNTRLGPDVIEAGFRIALGDEFEGLLKRPAGAMDALVHLEVELTGVGIRYGLGWGEVGTALDADAAMMDGPCFHRAREALAEAKQSEDWVVARGFGAEADAILNGIFSLLGAVRRGWTERQAETVALVRSAPLRKQAAAELGVVPSVVSEALAAALYGPVRKAESAAASALTLFGQTGGAHGTPRRSSEQ